MRKKVRVMVRPKIKQTRNRASPTMIPISGMGSPRKFSPLLVSARFMVKKIQYICLLTPSAINPPGKAAKLSLEVAGPFILENLYQLRCVKAPC